MKHLVVALLLVSVVNSFVTPVPLRATTVPTLSFESSSPLPRFGKRNLFVVARAQLGVSIDYKSLDDEKVADLFAWVSRAFAGDERYNNLVVALVAVFGQVPGEQGVQLQEMLDEAKRRAPSEEALVGAPFSRRDRESASLGAMGAAQWTGQWKTRPHALLDVRKLASAEEWAKALPRGARRTLARADKQNFTVVASPILGGQPAPHSSLAHFRCVVAHELRLYADLDTGEGFVDALAEACGRYMGTTRMAGEIREYRDEETGRVIAFAHEVRKGRVVRGQWFYATNEAARRYVWFQSVQDLVARAVKAEGVDVVDLGPSGSDAFSELKAKYGFKSVDEWTAVADYTSSGFWYGDAEDQVGAGGAGALLDMVAQALKER